MEELLNTTVTSVARREESIAQSAAAVHVITKEDIRRSGATRLAEVLRLAPGLQVARVDAHNWAVSARGFNELFANKLLVLIDGRSVYAPLFSGVFWDVQDVVLEDVERIEVIRGPGAALWGANAVNGVINVITKKAAATQGWLWSGGAGDTESGFGTIRYGGSLGDALHFRIYGKYFSEDDSLLATGREAHDDWRMGQGGFRIDWSATATDLLTLQGDIHHLHEDQLYERLRATEPFTAYRDAGADTASGGNVLARWTHTLASGSELVFQSYYDRTERTSSIQDERRDTFDIDFQHRFALGNGQTVVWGGGYRRTADRIGNSFDLALEPAARASHLFSAFVQDEVALIPKTLTLTLGSKFEHNDYTGFEAQPSARLCWTPSERHSVWAAVSRAVRTPSRVEDDIHLRSGPAIPRGALFPGSPTIVSALSGNRAIESETLIAYEAGYRAKVTEALSFDLAVFYHDYDELRGIVTGQPAVDFARTPAELSLTAGNYLKGSTYGGEVSANLRVSEWWRLRADYSVLRTHLRESTATVAIFNPQAIAGSNPQNQVSLRSWVDLPRGFEFDTTLRYVDSLPAIRIPAYAALDVRLGWRPCRNFEVSLVGQNLFDHAHPEFVPTYIGTQTTEVERSFYGKVTIRF